MAQSDARRLRNRVSDHMTLTFVTWQIMLSGDHRPRHRRQAGMEIIEYILLGVVVIGLFGTFMYKVFGPTVLQSMTGMLGAIKNTFSQSCSSVGSSC